MFRQADNVEDLCCFSVWLLRNGIGREGLGEKMYTAHKLKEEIPQAVDLNTNDSPAVTSIKKMILQMTSYDAKERPSSSSVYRNVQSIYRKVRKI